MIIESKSRPIKTIVLHMIIMAVILVTQVFYDFVYAQETEQNYDQNVPIVSNPALKLQIDPPTHQSYPSGKFTLTLTVDSLIDSNRVGIKWFYPSNLFNISGEERDVITVVKGQKTTITKEFTPKEILPPSIVNRGVNIAVEVNGFVAGENYLSSADIDLVFTPDMVIVPTLESYTREKTLTIIRIGAIRIGIVLLFGVAAFFLGKQLKDYLNTDEIV